MSDKSDNKSELDKYLEKDKAKKESESKAIDSLLPVPGGGKGLSVISENDPDLFELKKKEIGFTGRHKLKTIEREGLLIVARESYETKLSLWKSKLEADLQVGEAMISLALEQELANIEREHIGRLEELDLVAFQERSNLQFKLAQITEELSRKIENETFSKVMKRELISQLVDDRSELLRKITSKKTI